MFFPCLLVSSTHVISMETVISSPLQSYLPTSSFFLILSLAAILLTCPPVFISLRHMSSPCPFGIRYLCNTSLGYFVNIICVYKTLYLDIMRLIWISGMCIDTALVFSVDSCSVLNATSCESQVDFGKGPTLQLCNVQCSIMWSDIVNIVLHVYLVKDAQGRM